MTSSDTKTPSMRRMTHTHTVTHTSINFPFHLFRCDFCPDAISICLRSTCCVGWTSHRHSAMHFLSEIPSTIAHRKSIFSPYYYSVVFDVTTTFNAKTFRHVLARNASHTLSPPKHIRVCGWCREWVSAAKRQMTLCHSDSTTATWFIPLRWSKRTELRQAKVNRKVNEIEISRVLNTLFSAFNFICQFARNTWPYFPHSTHTHNKSIENGFSFSGDTRTWSRCPNVAICQSYFIQKRNYFVNYLAACRRIVVKCVAGTETFRIQLFRWHFFLAALALHYFSMG